MLSEPDKKDKKNITLKEYDSVPVNSPSAFWEGIARYLVRSNPHQFQLKWTEPQEEGLTDEEWKNNLYCYIHQGKQVHTNEEYFPTVRKWFYELSCWLTDNNQGVYITICLNELMRLEKEFGVFKKEGNGD